MCLAVPGKVLEVWGESEIDRMARVSFGGIVKEVCLAYTPDAQVGEYVIVHVGFALNKVDEEEAYRIFEQLREMEELGELQESDTANEGPG